MALCAARRLTPRRAPTAVAASCAAAALALAALLVLVRRFLAARKRTGTEDGAGSPKFARRRGSQGELRSGGGGREFARLGSGATLTPQGSPAGAPHAASVPPSCRASGGAPVGVQTQAANGRHRRCAAVLVVAATPVISIGCVATLASQSVLWKCHTRALAHTRADAGRSSCLSPRPYTLASVLT